MQQNFKHQFIQFAIDSEVLLFGSFTLKSGRISPYFFNTGLFNTGHKLAKLGQFYACTIEEARIAYDGLFAPAYKGIPLVSATSIALAEHHRHDLPYCFNRKEKKQYGDGGEFVGAPLKGRILIIDDVVSAGITSGEMIETINAIPGATVVGLIVALDRRERGQTSISALQALRQQYNIATLSIIQLEDIIDYLEKQPDNNLKGSLEKMKAYFAFYQ